MNFLAFRRRDRVGQTRNTRALRPAVDGFEPRLLMSGATISGTAFHGLTGNTVTVPDGAFQSDIVTGPSIDHLAANSNVLYHAQDRFRDGDTGADVLNTNPTTTGTQPASSGPATAAPVVVAVVTADTAVTSPDVTQARKH